MMDAITFLKHAELQAVAKQYNDTKREKGAVAFNLFTLSSYTSHLENFHSDIMAALLDPQGLHGQGPTFLRLFIDNLNKHHQTKISKDDFMNATVSRETGRLDIWIRGNQKESEDEVLPQSIIIENKINDAPDQEEQLDRYFAYATNRRNYQVAAVVYLTLDGVKKAPQTIENFGHLVKNIGAFTNQESDLLHGWLEPCYLAAVNLDSSTFIYQYIKLIKHLANKNMDTATMEAFYQFLSANNGVETVQAIMEMNSRMTSFRAERFLNSLTQGDYAPFRKIYPYRPFHLVLCEYHEGTEKFQLDVCFNNDGSASLSFWNQGNQTEEGKKMVTEKLEVITMKGAFNEGLEVYKIYTKDFKIGIDHLNMMAVDAAVLAFVKGFCERLNVFEKVK